MLQTMAEQRVLFYAMTVVCVIGIFSQLLLNRVYAKLLLDTRNVGVPRGKFMKQLKQRFANCQRLNDEVSNVSVFIKRQIMEYKYWNMNLHQWQKMGAYAFVICAVLGGIGYYLTAQAETARTLYLQGGIITCALLLIVEGVLDFRYKKKKLQTRLEDYLENTGIGKEFEDVSLYDQRERENKKVSRRLEQSKGKKEKQEAKETVKEGMNEVAAETEEVRDKNAEILKQMDPKEQERIIREVLKEFLA